MKISKHDNETLIVEEKPLVIGLIMIGFGIVLAVVGILTLAELQPGGLVLIVLSAGIFYAVYRLIEVLQIVFSRPHGTVELRKRSLHGLKLASYPLAEISGIVVKEEYTSSTGGGKTKKSQINLVQKSSGDLIPFTHSFSSGDQYQTIAKTIEEWLEID